MNRKTFIYSTFILSTIPIISHYWIGTKNELLELIQPLSVNSTREEIILMGKEYLKKFPDENSIEKLTQSIFNVNNTIVSENNHNDLVKHKIHEDFSNYNIIILKGWIITKTEGQICALYSKKYI